MAYMPSQDYSKKNPFYTLTASYIIMMQAAHTRLHLQDSPFTRFASQTRNLPKNFYTKTPRKETIMLLNAQNNRINIDNTDMDYVSFGKGKKPLIMLPGLGDGLSTVKGMALPLAVTYRIYAADYTVYIFSRKNKLEKEYSTRQMADDQAKAMAALGISHADVIGVSQGGMIAQYLAIDHPELVHKLVLAVTLSRPNETIQTAVSTWIQLASRGDHKNLMINTAEKSYSDKALKKYRMLYPLLGKIGKPKDFERFLIQADACLKHDAYAKLHKISCPTLVIGGDSDQIAGVHSSPELATAIQDSELYIYNGLGHAAYEEARDFNDRILRFLL